MTPPTTPKKKTPLIVVILIVAVVLVSLALACIIVLAFTGSTPEITATAMLQTVEIASTTPQAQVPTAEASPPAATLQAVEPTTEAPTATTTLRPTDTAQPTKTPVPTNTPLPPTATPSQSLVRPGTHLVGTDIQPGIYRGQAGYDLLKSCYWARLKDLSGSLDAILANDNSIGQFYIEVRDSDRALETGCELVFLSPLPGPPAEFPKSVAPGIYLVGTDISPGTYRGQAGDDIVESCYWARLRNVSGDLDAVLANDNATGQYYVQVQASDFALSTKCELERVED